MGMGLPLHPYYYNTDDIKDVPAYVDHRFMTDIQDLNEHQDELTDIRIKYMMDLYEKYNQEPREEDLFVSGQQQEGSGIENEAVMDNMVLMETLDEPMEIKRPTGNVVPLYPTKRQTMEDWRPPREHQFENEKYIQPLKRVYKNEAHLLDGIIGQKNQFDKRNHAKVMKGKGMDEMKIGANKYVTFDTWSRWMDINGFKINDNYEDAYKKARIQIYNNGDINQN